MIYKELLLEGGAAGHMNHLYDNGDLTFAKMKEIFAAAAEGKLEGTEKTDGQNLMISYSVKDGKAKGIRNATDVINGGVDAKKMKERYANHENPNLQHTFSEAILAFENAVRSLDHEIQVELFGEDTNIYYNAEVMDPRTPNRINYDTKNLVIHRVGHKEYDLTTGKPKLDSDLTSKAAKLEKIISDMQDEIKNDKYGVQINAVRKLKALSDKKPLHKAISQLNSAISAVNYLIGEGDMSLSDNSSINEYMIARVYILISSVINKQITYIGSISPVVKMTIVKRILGVKGISVKDIYKKVSPEQKEFLKQNILNESAIRIFLKTAIEPLEIIVSDFATDMLQGLESAFILNNDAQVKKLKDQVTVAIKKLEAYSKTDKPGAEDAMVFLKAQLKKLKSVERINAAAEGFVFDYDGVTYKFTGNFAPVNQILGVFDFGRGNIPPLKNEQLQEGKKVKETIALIPGAFKPPHRGHMNMVEQYAKIADRVIVLISALARPLPDGRGVTPQRSKDIFELYIEQLGLSNVEVIISQDATPVLSTINFISNKEDNPQYAQPGQTIILGSSTKGGDDARFNQNLEVKSGVKIVKKPVAPFKEMSATDMRQYISDGNIQKLQEFMPNNDKKLAVKVIKMFEGEGKVDISTLSKANQKKLAKKTVNESFIYDIILETITKRGNKYCLLSKKSRKNLGCYNSKSGAQKREKQVQYFKSVKEMSSSGAVQGAPIVDKDKE